MKLAPAGVGSQQLGFLAVEIGVGTPPERRHGGLSEVICLRPTDHIGWLFSGGHEFGALASSFLAEGASRGERLMYVAADPNPRQLGGLADRLGPGTLQIASIAEVYGPSGIVHADSQRATFAAALSEATGAGYSGIRVAADNTPLVTDAERLSAWTCWESVADRFMSENPVTGLCAFDREMVDVNSLRHLASLHPLSSANEMVPQYRIFHGNNSGSYLWIEGQIDSMAIQQVRAAMQACPHETGVVIDLTNTLLVTTEMMSGLRRLSSQGVSLTIRGATERARSVARDVGLPTEGVSWVDRDWTSLVMP